MAPRWPRIRIVYRRRMAHTAMFERAQVSLHHLDLVTASLTAADRHLMEAATATGVWHDSTRPVSPAPG